MDNKIDFVLTWVDGNDPEWQKEKQKYQSNKHGDKRIIRFRDWDNLHYWFRAVEQFAPWVNRIHFVTWGHIPEWLNVNHPKINIVKHSDFLPEEYTPSFSPRPMELNFHRIKGIADQFVYFNDDMFITKPVKKEDFFKNGLPVDVAIPYPCYSVNKVGAGAIISNNLEIINTHFNKKKSIRRNLLKWYNLKYKKHIISQFAMLPYNNFTGLLSTHIPHSYLKSTYEKVWEHEEKILDHTSRTKFRNKSNVNQWVMRYWQLASGNFMPRDISDGKNFMLEDDSREALKAIENQKYKLLCLNDTIDILDFDGLKKNIQESFNSILPTKSMYEI